MTCLQKDRSKWLAVGILAVIIAASLGFVLTNNGSAASGNARTMHSTPPGTVSENGVLTFDPAAAAEQKAAAALVDAGPTEIVCGPSGATASCSAVSYDDVQSDVTSDLDVYIREVRFGLADATAANGVPLFGANEVVCANATSTGTFSCVPVSSIAPSLGSGSTAIATYVPVRITSSGSLVGNLENPTVALAG